MKVAARCIDGTLCGADSSEFGLNVAVLGIVIRDGEVLVLPQFDGYDFPGGGMELGEDHISAMRREVKEETGFDVEPDGLVDACTTFFKSHKSGRFFQSVNLFYFAKIVGGKLSGDGFTQSERKYQKNPQFVSIEYLKLNRFLRYIDNESDLFSAIDNRVKSSRAEPKRATAKHASPSARGAPAKGARYG
ncbi:MAG: NUDIX domain-containing protein [Rickettsiales bacterium]|jgi:8-oxo-dGTP diphosphatase|nr:NUDIX domain-containing protein [Rickettsiales bacterium]